MALTSHAPLSIHHKDRYRPSSMSYASHGDDRNMAYPPSSHQSNYYSRPPGSSHGNPPSTSNPGSSPERLHSSSGYHQPPGSSSGAGGAPHSSPSHSLYQGGSHEAGPPGSSHGYSQSPITPLNTSAQPPYQSHSSGFYGLSTPTESHVPSPPPSSGGRAQTAVVPQFTPDGNPIVPVGISGGKMFQCRGYGDCDKVFTRSEHLARHVRKHTGERPFPCHCGKAFSRLDNLRQHAATVHADQGGLNDAMLNSLAPVHAALSQRANRDQRKRGEVVEVPKNAVERPRHNDARKNQSHDFGGYPEQWDASGRPRTGGGYDYPYPPVPPGEGGGPSRRPNSSGYSYQPYYEGGPRPPTAPGTASSQDSMSQLPYPYRPISSSGRDLPVPSHYAESEPPSSAHGPPQSPLYPGGVPPQGDWSSPPAHGSYHQPGMYPPPPPGSYSYDHGHSYGPPPPGSAGSGYNYPSGSGSYYPYPPVPHSGGPTASPSYGGSHAESPFHYHAPSSEYPYPYDRKRRAEDDHGEISTRKQPRPSSAAAAARPASAHGGPEQSSSDDPLWLPPATERRSSLAISALLGSPQQNPTRSRPATADIPEQQYQTFTYGDAPSTNNSSSVPATPVQGVNGTPTGRSREVKIEPGHTTGMMMEDKAKALLSAGGQR